MSDDSNINAESPDNQTLRPISIRLLYDGLIVSDDIYDSTGSKLLLASGNTISADHLERMYRLNSGSETIYVTERTQKVIATKRPAMEIARRVDLEDSTGYTAILAKVRDLYLRIGIEDKLDSEGFCAAADDLSELITKTETTDMVSLICAIAPVEEFLYRHIINVAMLNALIARWLKLPEEQSDKLLFIGLLHDCGMAYVPQSILYAPHKITLVEHEAVKMHTVHTDKLLADFPNDIRTTIGAHHERIDGSGYPKGLSGDKVTGASRITSVSNIYEAAVAARSYKPPKSPFHVLAMLDAIAPEQVDSNVVSVLRNNLPGHLKDKPVTMSDGTIGIVRDIDIKDIEFPRVELSKRVIKTNKRLHCVSMYSDE